jgi:hypothetical protein
VLGELEVLEQEVSIAKEELKTAIKSMRLFIYEAYPLSVPCPFSNLKSELRKLKA